jgi:hypothetical protein
LVGAPGKAIGAVHHLPAGELLVIVGVKVIFCTRQSPEHENGVAKFTFAFANRNLVRNGSGKEKEETLTCESWSLMMN